MKLSELRKAIREEVRKVVNEVYMGPGTGGDSYFNPLEKDAKYQLNLTKVRVGDYIEYYGVTGQTPVIRGGGTVVSLDNGRVILSNTKGFNQGHLKIISRKEGLPTGQVKIYSDKNNTLKGWKIKQ